MAFTPITGAISFANINTALGLSSTASISLNTTLVRQLTNQISGAVTMDNAHASEYIGTTTTNVNLLTRFGSPATVTSYKALIPSGVTVGATAGNTAFTVGQFPTGSTIAINNFGAIQAYGGSAGTSGAGGSGGDAINANYANQTVTINNQTGATIYGGGGGGGKGGSGGTGGTGGAGTYQAYNYAYCISGNYYFWCVRVGCCCGTPYNATQAAWANNVFLCVAYWTWGPVSYGGNTYIAQTNGILGAQPIGQLTNYGSSGGAGGTGGAGGGGGVGQGYLQANSAGSGGSAGSAGSAGGTNAGAGGAGGAGGTGGTGGTFGLVGSSGSTGSTGSTGASGNAGGGSGGSAGAGGSAGGTAGRYLVKGANSVTLNNSGTVLGGLA